MCPFCSDPNAPADPKPRQSVEARGFAYFPDHEPDTCSHLVEPFADVPVSEGVATVMEAINVFSYWPPSAQQWVKGLVGKGAAGMEELAQGMAFDKFAKASPDNKKAIVAALLEGDFPTLVNDQLAKHE